MMLLSFSGDAVGSVGYDYSDNGRVLETHKYIYKKRLLNKYPVHHRCHPPQFTKWGPRINSILGSGDPAAMLRPALTMSDLGPGPALASNLLVRLPPSAPATCEWQARLSAIAEAVELGRGARPWSSSPRPDDTAKHLHDRRNSSGFFCEPRKIHSDLFLARRRRKGGRGVEGWGPGLPGVANPSTRCSWAGWKNRI